MPRTAPSIAARSAIWTEHDDAARAVTASRSRFFAASPIVLRSDAPTAVTYVLAYDPAQ